MNELIELKTLKQFQDKEKEVQRDILSCLRVIKDKENELRIKRLLMDDIEESIRKFYE